MIWRYWPHAIGAVLGLALSAYTVVYLPMKANYERNGCVWIQCNPAEGEGR